MTRIDDQAAKLQQSGWEGESGQLDSGIDYSEAHVRLATVHARQDIVLMVAYLSSIANSINVIKQWAGIVGWLAILSFAYYVAMPFGRSKGWCN
jgi:uncharacterized membrane protein YagU involved in acid resistance